MFTNQSAELSLNAPCKSVTAVKADRLESRFLLGGCCIPDDSANRIHVVRYHSDVNVVGLDASLYHPTGPIQKLVASPNDRTLVLTLSEGQEHAHQVTLYKLPPSIMELSNELLLDSDTTGTDYGGVGGGGYNDSYRQDSSHHTYDSNSTSTATGNNSGVLESKLTLESPSSRMLDVAWRGLSMDFDDPPGMLASSTPGDVLTVDAAGTVQQWDLSMGLAESMHAVSVANASESTLPLCGSIPRVKWDPHHGSQLAVSWGRGVQFLDLRTAIGITDDYDKKMNTARAHRYGVTDLDYNPNKPFTLATSGMDGTVNYWDTRQTKRPIMTARGGHSHYSWHVAYNPFHDQLVLSTGTDAVANLWRVSTISSAPLLTLDASEMPNSSSSALMQGGGGDGSHAGGGDAGYDDTDAPNARVARHEASESIYSAAWSAADAWMYMTVAYDGRLALHHVPSKEKYKILL